MQFVRRGKELKISKRYDGELLARFINGLLIFTILNIALPDGFQGYREQCRKKDFICANITSNAA